MLSPFLIAVTNYGLIWNWFVENKILKLLSSESKELRVTYINVIVSVSDE